MNLLCEIRSIQVKAEGNILHTIRRWEAKWIGYILCRNCLLNHVTEEKTERRLEMNTIRRWEGKWIGYILCRNCLLNHVIEEKTEGRIEMTGR
jgi:hypothetical protein